MAPVIGKNRNTDDDYLDLRITVQFITRKYVELFVITTQECSEQLRDVYTIHVLNGILTYSESL